MAVKFILKEKVPNANWAFDAELGMVPMEVHLMKNLIHPNIIQYLDYFDDARFAYLITEMHGTSWTWPNPRINNEKNPGLRQPGQLLQLSNHGSKEGLGVPGVTRRPPCDLFECIEAHSRLPEKTILKIFRQLLAAVIYMYSQGIVHRDLKDENVVVDEDYHVKLIDFGSACHLPTKDGGYFERFNGTLAFAAPEVVRGLRYRPADAEVWSLGVLLYTMIFKKSPFNNTDAILHMQLDLPHEDHPGIYDLLRKMLHKNPQKRIRLDEIHQHPYLTK